MFVLKLAVKVKVVDALLHHIDSFFKSNAHIEMHIN
jgi:hypothetical protein